MNEQSSASGPGSPFPPPSPASSPGLGPGPWAQSGECYPPPRMMFCPPPVGCPPGLPGNMPYGYPPPQMGMPGRYPAYAQVPPGMYYPHPPPHRSGGSNCFRALVLFLLILILGFFVLQYMSVDFKGKVEQFYAINSFSVSNLSTSNSVLSCIWDTKVYIHIPTIDSKTYFRNFMVTIYFKNIPLVTSYGTSFVLDSRKHKYLEVRAEYNAGVEPQVAKSTVDELAKERDSGWVTFSLKISTEAHVDSKIFYGTSRQYVEAECNNLRVQFQNGSSSGTFNNEGNSAECFILR